MAVHVMVNIIDSCQKGLSLTSVTWAQVYIVQVIEVTWFFLSYPLTSCRF